MAIVCSAALNLVCSDFISGNAANYPLNIKSTSHNRRLSRTFESSPKSLPWEITRNNETLEVLSRDPLVYLVHDLLSPDECQSYMDYITNLSKEGDARCMTTSNPPQVSLVPTKLWPLPLLSILAGAPSLIRQLNASGDSSNGIVWSDMLAKVAPSIVTAFFVSAILVLISVPVIQAIVAPASRTSEVVALNQMEDLQFIRPLVGRVCRITNDHPWTSFEAPVVTRYKLGASFSVHNDASSTRGSEWSKTGGQRIVTALVYLNTCAAGGATSFDQLGIAVQPRRGSALVFFPADRHTLKADDRTRHESMPAVEEKWIVQMFGRIGPRVPPPLGIPDEFEPRMSQRRNDASTIRPIIN